MIAVRIIRKNVTAQVVIPAPALIMLGLAPAGIQRIFKRLNSKWISDRIIRE
jgi:hypothetical protein